MFYSWLLSHPTSVYYRLAFWLYIIWFGFVVLDAIVSVFLLFLFLLFYTHNCCHFRCSVYRYRIKPERNTTHQRLEIKIQHIICSVLYRSQYLPLKAHFHPNVHAVNTAVSYFLLQEDDALVRGCRLRLVQDQEAQMNGQSLLTALWVYPCIPLRLVVECC